MSKRPWKLDRKITAMMVEDMLFDPILACKVILNTRLPPHEELRIAWMWTHYYTNDDSGFSTGKSWTFAAVAALRSILLPGRVSGVLSKTFAQGQLIFQYLERWYDTNPIFRSCVKHAGGKRRLVHDSAVWKAEFRGGSEIRVLPPGFLTDAERIRSERWNDAYLDEWNTYGNFDALNRTIMGRVTRINRFKTCPVRRNHIHLAATPNFKHHPSYNMIKVVDREMARGNRKYGRFSCNWRHVPNTDEWDWLINDDVIYHMQRTLPKGIVLSEVDGIWSDDSASWYPSSIIEECRYNAPTLITKRRADIIDPFICGYDVAPGGGDNKTRGQGDDFAVSVFRDHTGIDKCTHVLTLRAHKISDVVMSGLIHMLDRIFDFALICGDPGGGGLFVKDKLRLDKQMIGGAMVPAFPIVTVTDQSGTIGASKLIMFDRSDHYVRMMWGKMNSDSILINRIHTEFRGALENHNVTLSGPWDGWDVSTGKWDVDDRRRWLNENWVSLREEDRYKAEMDLAVMQLVQVDVERGKDSMPLLDSFGMKKFSSKKKKDSAYSLVYGYMGCLVYRWMRDEGMIQDKTDDNQDVVFASAPL